MGNADPIRDFMIKSFIIFQIPNQPHILFLGAVFKKDRIQKLSIKRLYMSQGRKFDKFFRRWLGSLLGPANHKPLHTYIDCQMGKNQGNLTLGQSDNWGDCTTGSLEPNSA